MKIELYWPDCNFVHGRWGVDRIDSFWLECTTDEARKKVFPLLSDDRIQESETCWHQQGKAPAIYGMDSESVFFLVSKDLSSIMPLSWVYPHSGQWGGYCPFVRIKPVLIVDLRELPYIQPVRVDGTL